MRPVAAVAAAVLVLGGCSVGTQPTGGPTGSVDPTTAVAALLSDLSEALDAHEAAALSALAEPDVPQSAEELADLVTNAQSLGLSDVTMDPVGEQQASAGRLTVSVQVTWREPGQPGPLSARLPMVIAVGQGSASFVTARVPGVSGVPLWSLGRLDVVRAPGVLVESLDPASTARYEALALQAQADLERYLATTPGQLVVQVPAGAGQFESVVPDSGRASLAAATIESFGADQAWIVVDPEAMAELSDLAAQIVITHEAVHVALDAPRSAAPMWLQEGYADYVAFASHPVPVRQAAVDLIRQVTRAGVPQGLPTPQEFEGGQGSQGAAYESAWLACRWIAGRYGADRLRALYQAEDRGVSEARALRQVLGLTPAELTAGWRVYVTRIAG